MSEFNNLSNNENKGSGLLLTYDDKRPDPERAYMGYEHISLGMYGYFVEENIHTFKQNFYIASKLGAASAKEDGGETLSMDDSFLYPLLSDSAEIINTYSRLEPEEYLKNRDNPRAPQFFVHMIQLVLRDEHEALRVKIEKGARGSGKLYREEFKAGQDFYSLLLKRDWQALEARILKEAQFWETIIKKGKMTGNPWTEDFLATNAVMYAKLCWMKGIEVQVDSPLVPKDLLPVAPLPYYDDPYDFLKPGWVPPPRGLLSKISRWF
jgi:hypothetical protein